MNITLTSIARLTTLLTALTTAGFAAQPEVPIIQIAIVDDHSGGLAKGALDQFSAPELEGLLALPGGKAVELQYLLVQEAAAEGVKARIEPWAAAGPMPELPSSALPAAVFEAKMREYSEKMRARRAAHGQWKVKALAAFEGFKKDAARAQGELELRWQIHAEKEHLKDWNRSDIEGAVLLAERGAASATRSYLILATDAQNQPAGKKPRTTPFTPQELPASTVLVWIVPDGKAPDAPLFRGLSNRTLTAPGLAAAVSAVVEEEKQARTKNPAEITGTATK